MPLQQRQRSVSPDGILDEISNIDELERHGYNSKAFILDAAEIRNAMEYAKKLGNLVGMSDGGYFFHAAGMPYGLVMLIETLDPDLFRNRERFYKYLDRHPYFKTGYAKQMTSIAGGNSAKAARQDPGNIQPNQGVHNVASRSGSGNGLPAAYSIGGVG